MHVIGVNFAVPRVRNPHGLSVGPKTMHIAVAEDPGGAFRQSLLPGLNLPGMDFIPGGQLGHRFLSLKRFQRHLRSTGVTAVIPPKSNRKEPWEYDKELYRERNLIERAFNKLKHWRRIAIRYDRRSIYFLSALYLVSSVISG